MPSSMSSDILQTRMVFLLTGTAEEQTALLTSRKISKGNSHLDLDIQVTGTCSRCIYVSCCTDLLSRGTLAWHHKHTQHNTLQGSRDSKVRSVTCSRPSFGQHRPSEARGIGTGFEQDSGMALTKALRQDTQSRFSLSHTRSHPILLLLPLQYSAINTS